MQIRGPLMKEHRLIERLLTSFESQLAAADGRHRIEPALIDVVVDFIRTYADRTHHGKEEDILFAALAQRDLNAEDSRAMEDLIADHVFGRETTSRLAAANARFRGGEKEALAEVVDELRTLIDFYPRHIAKEDKHFFPAARAYFTEEEEQAMLARFREFDCAMIHEKYEAVVAALKAEAVRLP